MRYLDPIILALALFLMPSASAASPLDMIAAPLQGNLNINDLEKKALEHIAQGNLTQEHIRQDLNATGEKIRTEAEERINQGLNVTSEQLEQRAKDELKNQINQKVQPGFEALFALIGLMGLAFAMGRRN